MVPKYHVVSLWSWTQTAHFSIEFLSANFWSTHLIPEDESYRIYHPGIIETGSQRHEASYWFKCTTTLLYQNISKVWTPNCFIRENSSQDTPSTASLLAISVLIRETSCSAVDRTKSKVPGNAEGCGSPVIMMETHGVGRGGMIVNPKSFHPKRCWNTTKIIPKWNLKKPLKTAILVQDFEMFNKHSPGGNVGKPQDPHRLPQLTPHISKVCLPHGGEPRHIRISSNFPSACNEPHPTFKLCESIEEMDGPLGLGKPQQSISSKSSYWKKNVMENLTTFPMCAWTLAMNNLPVENPCFLGPLLACFFLLLSEQYGISQTRLLDTQKLGSSDFHNDLPNLKGKIKQNWSPFQQHFIQSPKIKSPNPSTLSFPNALCQPSSVVSANGGSPRSGNCLGVSLEQVVVWARKPNPLCCLSHPAPGWTNVNQQHNSTQSVPVQKNIFSKPTVVTSSMIHNHPKNLNFHKKKPARSNWFNKNQQS